MKKKTIVKIIVIWLICLIVGLFPILLRAFSEPSSNFEYSRYNCQVDIYDSGDAHFKETFSISSNKLLHYYYKEFIFDKDPEHVNTDYKNSNQVQIDYNTFKVSVKNKNINLDYSYLNPLNPYLGNKSDNIIAFNGGRDELGETIICSERNCEKVGIYLKDGITSDTVFTIEYNLKYFVTAFNDVSGFIWNFVPSLEAKKKNVELTINLPENNFELGNSSNEKDISKIHYYGAGGSSSKFDNCTNKQIKVKNKSLKYDESIEVLVSLPTAMFNINKDNCNYFDLNNETFFYNIAQKSIDEGKQFERNYVFFNFVCGIASIGFVIVMIFIWMHVYRKYDKELKSDFDSKYYRELPASYPPAIMGFLYNEETVSTNDLNATLMDLIRRDFISVDYSQCNLTDENPNYKLIYNRDKSQDELLPFEVNLLSWYFDIMSTDKNTITLDEIDQFVKSEKNALVFQKCDKIWGNFCREEGEKHHFFDKKASMNAKKYSSIIIIAILIIMLNLWGLCNIAAFALFIYIACVLAMALSFIVYVNQVIRKTPEANEEYVRWKAFKNFLMDFSTFEDYPLPGIKIWEHYLVYATSFGIADLVQKQLRTKYKEYQRFDEYQSSTLCYTNMCLYMRIRLFNTIRIGQSTIITAQANRSSSGRSGGHGGFGGGSFHGGGGGHSGAR